MASSGFAGFARKLDALGDDLADAERVMNQLGKAAKDDVREAVSGDIGDTSMSHWRRNAPIEIAARYDVTGDHSVEVKPTPRARGPMRVLEDGRQAGGSFDLVQVGKARKDGTRRGRSRGRNQGATAGKGTWSDAEALIADRTPKRVHEQVQAALRRIF